MKKKHKKNYLGRALINNCTGMKKTYKSNGDCFFHNKHIDESNKDFINFRSVTEENSFTEFFSTVELVRTEFQAKKITNKFAESQKEIKNLFDKKYSMDELLLKGNKLLKIMRRPKWDKLLTLEQLQIQEQKEFMDWKRKISQLEETYNFSVTPYEKNLEFWRQLWRVIERSNIIAQVVDARNPLFYYCEDLEQYVKEISSNKINIILINKADFLTLRQRQIWAKYFSETGVQVIFFSNILSVQNEDINYNLTHSKHENDIELKSNFCTDKISSSTIIQCSLSDIPVKSLKNLKIDDNLSCNKDSTENYLRLHNDYNILSKEELISLFKNFYKKLNCSSPITVGFVGYPNVGKSSIINTLFMEKKVSVSVTPGKTKHFQTLYLDKEIILCDCPGLVMPSFVQTKAELLLNGILPINELQDYVPSINLLGTLIPKHVIEKLYGISIPFYAKEKKFQPPTAEDILNAHGYNRGFMTQRGQPDNARSARYILKDFVDGKLLYCIAPPNYSQNKFHSFNLENKKLSTIKTIKSVPLAIKNMDRIFLEKNMNIHVKGLNCISVTTVESSPNGYELNNKPWKMHRNSIVKSHKKTRRIYSHLDEY